MSLFWGERILELFSHLHPNKSSPRWEGAGGECRRIKPPQSDQQCQKINYVTSAALKYVMANPITMLPNDHGALNINYELAGIIYIIDVIG